MMKKINFADLLISVLIAQLIGLLSSLLAGNQKEIYSSLSLPALAPPSWVFPVAWIILYFLMGISSYLIYSSETDYNSKRNALLFYAGQLFFNFLWSIVFFRFEAIGLSVVVIIILIVLVILTIISFYRINKISAYLLIPYLIWLLFALYLNINIYFLQK